MSMLNIAKKLNRLNKASLTEAKADTQKLIDFAGEDLAKRFIAIKHKLKAPRNDLYFWIKNKTPDQLLAVVQDAEETKSNRQLAKEADQGAELICETDYWKVYHITSFAASQKYGRDSKWCITGVNGYGDRYWKLYTEQGVKFYFLITKVNYDPRGTDSKFAVAVYKDGSGELYDQQDEKVGFDSVPYSAGIEIPGVDLDSIHECIGFCDYCDTEFYDEDEINYGPNGEYMCESCYEKHCFTCYNCYDISWISKSFTMPDGSRVCERCFESAGVGFCDGCGEIYYYDSLHEVDNGLLFCDDCYEEEEVSIDEAFQKEVLTEAKADIQKLVDYAGEDYANRFLAVKHMFKYPETDLYYWIRNCTVLQFKKAVVDAEKTIAEKRLAKNKKVDGTSVVCETPNWKVYHITTYEASQAYGRDTQWCITGINDWGDRYWNNYIDQGVSFYFLIAKNNYDPRGLFSKIALAIYPDNKCEVFNQRDGQMSFYDIPNVDEINIPGIDLRSLDFDTHFCHDCNHAINEYDIMIGLDNREYCEDCWHEYFFCCDICEDIFKIEDSVVLPDGRMICEPCSKELTGVNEALHKNTNGYNMIEFSDKVGWDSSARDWARALFNTLEDDSIRILDYYEDKNFCDFKVNQHGDIITYRVRPDGEVTIRMQESVSTIDNFKIYENLWS